MSVPAYAQLTGVKPDRLRRVLRGEIAVQLWDLALAQAMIRLELGISAPLINPEHDGYALRFAANARERVSASRSRRTNPR